MQIGKVPEIQVDVLISSIGNYLISAVVSINFYKWDFHAIGYAVNEVDGSSNEGQLEPP